MGTNMRLFRKKKSCDQYQRIHEKKEGIYNWGEQYETIGIGENG